ncbi:Odorant receptor 29, partial [Frankliniella occidentalis]
MTVSQKLLTWRRLIAPRALHSCSEKWFQCLYNSFATSITVGLALLLFIGGFIQEPSFNGIDVTFGYYSNLYGHVFMMVKGGRIESFLRDLADVVKEIESKASTPVKAELQRADQSIRRNVIYFCTFYALLLCSMLPESIITGISHAPMWPQLPGALGDWSSVVLLCSSMITGAGLYFVMWALVFSVLITLTALLHAIALQLELAASKREVIDLIKYHQRVKDLSRRFETLFATHLMHLLASSFLVPLTCTIK